MTPDEQAAAADLLTALTTGRTRQGEPVKVAEVVTLQKFEGEGTAGRLLETIRIQDGVIIEQIVHPRED